MFYLVIVAMATIKIISTSSFLMRILLLELVTSSTMGFMMCNLNLSSLYEVFFPVVVVMVGESCVGLSLLIVQLKVKGNDLVASSFVV
uniref:NADH dehydrogenase subunit 4L n=2 Tax=unclassified Physidae TaxID=1724862 RepID=A0A8F8SNR9_9GAST|nr:NADH dehydrogenase subunit 4L [Physidae sp. PE4]QYB18824.1 NADH dehydrogenase subunit 4L [Physidae sp. P3S_19]